MAGKKDLLKKAAGAAVKKTLGGEVSPEDKPNPKAPETSEQNSKPAISESISTSSSEPTRSVPEQSPKPETHSTPSEAPESREKQLPKKEPIFKLNNGMRIEEYTQTGLRDSNGNKKWIRILGVFLVLIFVWWIWPSKHEIYMDVDKMTPDKVSGMGSEKEYHFTHGQDFFIYYRRGGWFSPDKIKLTIYKVDESKEEISVQEKEFKRRFDKFQTYYDDSFFDDEGSYEAEIKDENGEILVTKKFTID
ncbi:hypothetical protein EHQ52_08775 [Leptospira koniambonensis]|uniref:Uncharacterized protein n=1 Tax=Leptospira koniambonensis TaxID=2484950 RepID=A0A4R9J9I2_9LEPT|nr:hypothetical protein [Leptospira koniambonensis]TGL34582.1 hypothetical protein EHQ52_08775 [Leptospira koniambonensis]